MVLLDELPSNQVFGFVAKLIQISRFTIASGYRENIPPHCFNIYSTRSIIDLLQVWSSQVCTEGIEDMSEI